MKDKPKFRTIMFAIAMAQIVLVGLHMSDVAELFGDLPSLLFYCALWLIVPMVNWCVASFTQSEETRRKAFAVACYYLLWFALYALPESSFGGTEPPQNLHLLFAPMLMLGLLPLAHLGEYLITRNRPQGNEHA